jgi:hypothetical protein
VNDKLIQSQLRLRDSFYDLYEKGGLDLMMQAAKSMKRDLIIKLKTTGPTQGEGEVLHFYAVNRWDADDEFDEWARPSAPLSQEAEKIVGTTNGRLALCRPTDMVMEDFLTFLEV